MYLQHSENPVVYKLKYFTPDTNVSQGTMSTHRDKGGSTDSLDTALKKRTNRSFLEPDESSFARIRNRLSTLSLSTAYKSDHEGPVISPPFQRERKLPPRRISSISSRDTLEKGRLNSRASFYSDSKELQNARRNFQLPHHRASETAALRKLNENYLTPGQNPELFSRQIRLKDKSRNDTTRSSSPKSMKSTDSSGKIHLGLIESLDLNEKLSDVEKIKERYSNNTFMNSLSLYKLRGHDRCLKNTGYSEHIPRGTRIPSPEAPPGSKLSSESAYAINSVISPRLVHTKWQWEPEKSHMTFQTDSKHKTIHSSDRKTPVKRKKSVGFNMTPKEHSVHESEQLPPPSASDESIVKEVKSILKRSNKDSCNTENLKPDTNNDDEFIVNESHHWKYHLPKIRSPVNHFRAKPPLSFQRKMYHFGDGISTEFEQVISKYGNCRQSSWIREHSLVKDSGVSSKV